MQAPGRCKSTGSCTRRAGAPKPAAERANTGGGGRAPDEKEGGKPPAGIYPDPLAVDIHAVFTAAIRENLDQTRARARRSLCALVLT
jgi:hypothetical protein